MLIFLFNILYVNVLFWFGKIRPCDIKMFALIAYDKNMWDAMPYIDMVMTGTCDIKCLTLIGYDKNMWYEVSYSAWVWQDHAI